MQRFRGRTYLADGAITPEDLTWDGRHEQGCDSDSWHVLSVDQENRVCGAARYRHYEHLIAFREMSAGRAEIANSQVWGAKLERAVRFEYLAARSRGMGFAEVGGWALDQDLRGSMDALRIALTVYGLAQLLGGCVGLTTATVRHSSAAILRKIGGRSLAVDGHELPRYFDSRYKCDMEILRFDSSRPNPKFAGIIEKLKQELTSAELVCHAATANMDSVSDTVPALPDVAGLLSPAIQPVPVYP